MRMHATFVFVFLFVGIASAPAKAESLKETIENIRKKNGVPALAVMELKDGRVVAQAFTGVRKIGDPTPIQSTDQFHLGSDTKAMTATLIGMLIEESKLRWNSTLGEIFPDLPLHPAYTHVSVEMLLAHRAGLPANPTNKGFLDSLTALSASKGRKQVLEHELSQAPDQTPASKYQYSNLGYVILGAIIEKVSGETYEQFIQKHLFKKLGMGTCGFGPPGDPKLTHPNEPWGHSLEGKSLVPIAPTLEIDNPPAYNSAANVHCSLQDWGKFLEQHVGVFKGKHKPLLSNATFEKLHTAYPGQEYTYGGWISGTRDWADGQVLFHEGSNTMNVALAWLAPHKKEFFMSVANAPIRVARPAVNEAIVYLIHH